MELEFYERVPKFAWHFYFRRECSINICYIACNSLCTALFRRFFASRRASERVRFIEIMDQRKRGNGNAKYRSRAPACRTCGLGDRCEKGRLSHRAEGLTADLQTIVSINGDNDAVRIAANSKSIRRVHARKSSTSSVPNNDRADLIPHDRAVQTDVCHGG